MKEEVRFFLKNFNGSKITCVDTWCGSDEHKSVNFELMKKTLISIHHFINQINIYSNIK